MTHPRAEQSGKTSKASSVAALDIQCISVSTYRWMSPGSAAAPQVASWDTLPLVINANDRRRGVPLSMHPIDTALVEALTGLVSQAGRAILEIARELLALREKADFSPVTAADEAAQTVILDGLARLLPGVPAVFGGIGRRAAGDLRRCELRSGRPARRHQGVHRPKGRIHRQSCAHRGGTAGPGLRFSSRCGLLYRGRVGNSPSASPAGGAAARSGSGRRAARTRCRPAPPRLVAAVSRLHLDPAT